MPAQMDTVSNMFEQMLDNMRKAADQTVKMQQDMFQRWTQQFSSMPAPQGDWLEAVHKMQREWADTVMSAIRRQREALDKQYAASLGAIEEALHSLEARDPADFRKRCEDICRRSADAFRQAAETGMGELQTLAATWSEMFNKARGT